jgi:hypothetical protein
MLVYQRVLCYYQKHAFIGLLITEPMGFRGQGTDNGAPGTVAAVQRKNQPLRTYVDVLQPAGGFSWKLR